MSYQPEHSQPIAVVEPQMEGVHHAPFNAALLHAVALGFPDAAVSFQASPEHTAVVRGIVLEHAPEIAARVEWRSLPLPKGGGLVNRWLGNNRLIKQALQTNTRVLFTSISRMQLLQLKRAMKRGYQARAVLHGDLDRILQPATERFPQSLMALDRVLKMPTPKGLKLLLLSESIRASLPEEFRAPMRDAGVIDHPYHFPPVTVGVVAAGDALVMGTFGNTGDGVLLQRVATAVRAKTNRVRFRLVGFLSDADAVERLRGSVEEVTAEPIARSVFVERARSLTHSLWLAEPGAFKLRASGTFFDALSYAKPLVYTANPYIDAYFAEEPAIGVRCERVEDVPAAIERLAAEHTAEGYEAAQSAMLRLRERFTPQALAARLPAILDW